MKNKLLLNIAVIGLGCLCFAVGSLKNAQATMVSDLLVEDGVKSYKEGDEERAIEHFSKALILDPDNSTAKEYLKKMGLDEGLYHPEKGGSPRPAKDMAQEAKEAEEYQAKLNALEQEKFEKEKRAQMLEADKIDLKRAIDIRNQEADNLREELEKMQDEMAEQEKLQESLRADARAAALKSEKGERLSKQIDRQMSLIEEKDKQIKQLQRQLKSSEKEVRKKSLGYENQILSLKKEHRKSQSANWKQDVAKDEKIELLRSRLRNSRTAIATLNDNIILVNRKLASLENQLTVKDTAIKDLEQILSTQKDACPGLKKKLTALQKKLSSADQAGSKKQTSDKDQSADSGSCPDAAYYKKQDEKVADLKKRLVEARQEIVSLKQSLAQPAADDTAALKQQLTDMESELKKKDAAIADEEASYDILEQRLKDAQERLNVADQMIQKKDKQIKDMEKQIEDMVSAQADEPATDVNDAPAAITK